MTTATPSLDHPGRTGLPIEDVARALRAAHGDAEAARIDAGVRRVAERWSNADGDAAAFTAFCTSAFVPTSRLPLFLERIERGVELVSGHLAELRRHLRRWTDLRCEELPFVDDMLATFDPAPDLAEESYRQKLAFAALLNLDRPSLAEMLASGPSWTTDQWAAARIAQSFGPRIPKALNDRARSVGHRANQWVAKFHVPVGRLATETGERPFAEDRALLAHWLVREEIKAGYNDPDRARGLRRQRALAWTMARHIDGTIPKAIMERRATGPWDPRSNTIDGERATELLGPIRYRHWLEQRDLAFEFDLHHPEHPTAIRRKCELAREIPEAEVVRLLRELLSSSVRRELAAHLESMIGRPLEPFDIYIDEIADAKPAEEMNALVARLAADASELERKLPELLQGLGFPREDAEFLGTRIKVEIARGSGHASRPHLPEYGAWLRTSSLEREIGWDGFDTAMHELGHTLEQLVSTHFVARPALRGVPNTACTEAFAFLYQSLGKRVLGVADLADEARSFDIDAVQTLANACQIAGPALLELEVWNWIYRHPEASAEELRDEVLRVAASLWREFYAEDFGDDTYHLLAAYQHMIAHPLYLADYPLGLVIGHQIRSHLRGRDLARETRRICAIGRTTPDLWMRKAVGTGISVAALVDDARSALARLKSKR
jgi:hypothetical protein